MHARRLWEGRERVARMLLERPAQDVLQQQVPGQGAGRVVRQDLQPAGGGADGGWGQAGPHPAAVIAHDGVSRGACGPGPPLDPETRGHDCGLAPSPRPQDRP
eukprot:1096565-Rhodomonas_salina.2